MAELVDIGGGQAAKVRSIWAVALLSLVPFYILFWWYFVNREMADFGRARGTTELGENPTSSVLALFPGGLIIVPAIITIINTFKRVQAAQRLTGQTKVISGWIGVLLLVVISPAFYAYMQSGLNSAWETLTPRPAAATA